MHAALVTAYKDFAMLERLVTRLQALGMKVFIHVDKRSTVAPDALDRIRSLGAEVHSWYPVHWGSRSHLGALLKLMRMALRNPAITYIHTLSGQDYPIKSAEAFDEICDGRVFMDCLPIDSLPEKARSRFEHYHIRDLLDPVLRLPARADEFLVNVQKHLRIRRRRTRSHASIMKGLVWLSMPADAARYCCESGQARRLWRELKYSTLPEEFYFQTLLYTSPFQRQIDPDNRRFMDWTPRGGARPAVLDQTDCAAIHATNALFARKFDSRVSGDMLNMIDQKLLAPGIEARATMKDEHRQSTHSQAVSP
jgi:hypothetical protein